MQHSVRVLTFYLLQSGLAWPGMAALFRLIVLESVLLISHGAIILSPLSLPPTHAISINKFLHMANACVAITGFSNFFHCNGEHWKPTTTMAISSIYWFWKIGRQYTIANEAYEHCWRRQLSVFKRMDTAFCFTDLTFKTLKKQDFSCRCFGCLCENFGFISSSLHWKCSQKSAFFRMQTLLI